MQPEQPNRFDLLGTALRDAKQERDQLLPEEDRFAQLGERLRESQYASPPQEHDLLVNAVDRDSDAFTPVTNSRPDKLSKRDLLAPENMSVIRNYMSRRYGQEMVDRYDTDEKLMERFVDSMRFFHGNMLGTAGEATWVMNADETGKQSANQAYDLFDRLGNVFTVDGVAGALDGMKDYIFAAARDPSSYLGLFTGGAAKAATLASQGATQRYLRVMAKKAGRDALRQNLSGEAQEEFVRRAMTDAVQQIGRRHVTEQGRKRLFEVQQKNARNMAERIYQNYPTGRLTDAGKVEMKLMDAPTGIIAESARQEFREGVRVRAEQEFFKNALKRSERFALLGAGAGDALAAFGSDVALQNTYMEVGAQEKYSAAQTAIGTITGGLLAPGMKVVGDFAQSLSGRTTREVEAAMGKVRTNRQAMLDMALSKNDMQKVVGEITSVSRRYKSLFEEAKGKDIKAWEQKVQDGKVLGSDDLSLTAQFFRDLVFGSEDGEIGGLLKLYQDKGLKVPSNVRVTDFFSNLVRDIDGADRVAINEELKFLGLGLGDFTEGGAGLSNLGDVWAAKVSEAAALLNVSSQLSKTLNLGLIKANLAADKQAKETVEAAGGEANVFAYGQSLWRRMLVSNPATSMVNIAGFGMYMGSQGIAESLTMAQQLGLGVVRESLGLGGKEQFRRAKIYREMIGQKMYNVLDPHTTRANFEVVLDEFDAARQTLINNLTGGIDIAAKRHGLDPATNEYVKAAESVANVAARSTLVFAQDSVTKSLMFMSDLDRRIRLKYNRTLDDVLVKGDLSIIDPDLVNQTMDDTMASVYSRNYTISENASPVMRQLAGHVESISNLPFFGQVLPFGRFMNNVLGNLWRFGPGGVLRLMSDMRKNNVSADTYDAFNRSL